MPRHRLLALDIDGTLVNSDNELTPTTRDALVRARRAGIHVVLATGRRYSRTLPLVEPLGVELPLVTASGALIKHALDHRTLYRAEFAGRTLHDALAFVERAGYDAIAYADTFADGFDFYCPRVAVEGPLLTDFFRLNVGCARELPTLMREPPPGVFALFAMGTRDEMLRLERELGEHLPESLSTHVLRSPRYLGFMCEIAPVGITKWSGIRQLAAQYGITDAEICAVGDDVNDLPMIAGAGLGVAMANAPEEIRTVADRVAPSNDHDGLVEVVRWLLDE